MAGRDPLSDPAPLIRRVYAYVAYRIGAGADAEDVTSDVFERAVRYRGTYDPRKGDPVAWLIGIARRSIADRAARPELASEQPLESPEQGFEGDVVRRLVVGAAVSRLPDRDRELIALRYGADLTAKQIAAIVDDRVNTVEVALHRALERLRTELADEEGGATDRSALETT